MLIFSNNTSICGHFLRRVSTLSILLLAGLALKAQSNIPDSLGIKETSAEVSVIDTTNRIRQQPLVLKPKSLLAQADSLRMNYEFKEAVNIYQQAMNAAADSLERISIEDKLILGQNGLSMMGYCSQPVVVAKQKFSLEDFFLFYPMKDRSWRAIPNQLDSLSNSSFVKAMFVPDNSESIYYSAQDEDGIRNIYVTKLLGEQWSAPSLINEQTTSSSDEIFPILSSDGRTLFFASEGLYGMGGYDLYASQWNKETKDWDTPVNMGFPYSSPYDDFLYMNTDDGKYSIFASNRECSRDSVYLYVLEYDSMPVRKSLSDVDFLKKLAALSPAVDPSRIDNASAVSEKMPDDADTQRYIAKMTEVRELRDAIYQFGKSLDNDRLKIASLEGSEKTDLMNSIMEREMELPSKNDSLSRAVKELQQIEMDFLVNGFVIDPDKLKADADKEVVGASSGYTFTKKSMGPSLNLNIQKPVREFDYTFMILPEGRFAEDNTIPSGLVYQIQMMSRSTKATIKDIKGLSPVFEKLSPSLRYIYSVGVFRSYQDALANINKVKKAGFRDAIITAYNNGKSITVKEARSMESQITTVYTVKIYPEEGQGLPDLAKTAIKQHTDKDIAKTIEDGVSVYLAGPFDDKAKAESLITALKATGVSNAKIGIVV